ncbi:uncharacterized protein ARMOST_16362 [Armillaria ostoyae]|uniref:PIG-P domain-containing protein n=1 Tax=Armillaria ostoyae TaxID=47428 RepID=A0A284RW03_ARMOS|nr:uncharacterized protein ARMOST_16362 [Armillaria ostoyae]
MAASSSKAFQYAINGDSRSEHQAVLVTRVVLGNPQLVRKEDHKKEKLDKGYHSVEAHPENGGPIEDVVFDHNAPHFPLFRLLSFVVEHRNFMGSLHGRRHLFFSWSTFSGRFYPTNTLNGLALRGIPVGEEWAVLLPAYSVVVFLLAYFVYFALAIYGAPSLSDTCTFTDSRSHYLPVREGKQGYASFARPDAVPELYDVPIGLVNRVLYHDEPSAD